LSCKEHTIHIRKILEALKETGLNANPNRCQLGGDRIECMGHSVGAGKISIPEARAEAIAKYVIPTTK